MDAIPAVIVKALYGNGVKPAIKIIKKSYSLKRFFTSNKVSALIILFKIDRLGKTDVE